MFPRQSLPGIARAKPLSKKIRKRLRSSMPALGTQKWGSLRGPIDLFFAYHSLRFRPENIASFAGSVLVGLPILLLSGLVYAFKYLNKLRSDRTVERSDARKLPWPCSDAGKWSPPNVTSTNYCSSTAYTEPSADVYLGTNDDDIQVGFSHKPRSKFCFNDGID